MRRTLFTALAVCLLAAPAEANSFLDRKISDWLSDLGRGGKPAARRSAAFALGRMGADASLAIPDLIRLVETDPDPTVRDMAAAAVGEIVLTLHPSLLSHRWEGCGKVLQKALTDGDPRVRRSAAYALGAFGRAAFPASEALRKALRDPISAPVRQNAAWALGRIGEADAGTVADLIDRLADSGTLVRRDAAAALERLGQSGKRKAISTAGKPLLDMVKAEKDEVVRKTALGALASLSGPEHRDQAADLYPLLDSKDDDTRRGAAYVLGNMGGDPARRALPELKKALADADPTVQALAAACLANAGPDAADAVDDLARALTVSKDTTVRRNCCIALGHLGKEAKPAVPSLVAAMKPVGPATPAGEEVRELAAEALAQIRYPHNLAAIDAVRERIAKDKNQLVRQRCVWALFNLRDLDEHNLTPTLTTALEDTDDESLMVRYDCARVLAFALEAKAPDQAVTTLLHMLNNKKLRVFNKTDSSIEGAGKEGGGGSTGVAQDIGGDARYMAAEALGWMGAKAKSNTKVIDSLRDAARDPDDSLRKKAAASLEKLGIEK